MRRAVGAILTSIGGVVALPMLLGAGGQTIDRLNGRYPSFIMIGDITLTVPQFYLVCGIGTLVGVGLIGAGLQVWFSTPEDR